MTPQYTAVFPTVAAAKAYAEATSGPGDWAVNMVQKGRTVTFDIEVPEQYREEGPLGGLNFYDLLERVGYYGSTQNRKATLNGVRPPSSGDG